MLNSKALSDMKNGGLSSFFIVFITQPLQVIRTSMMVTYKNEKTAGMLYIFKKIIKKEGYKGFYRGFTPSILKTTIGSGIYFGCLETLKDFFKKTNIKNKTNYNHSVHFFSGGIARFIQSICVNPILVVKTRFEVVGFNSYSSILDALKKIKQEEGVGGYFKGLRHTLVKEVPSSAMFYTLYELFKNVYKKYLNVSNLQLQATCASISTNIILIFLTNPIDVIRTRIQYLHFSKNEKHNYNGIIGGFYDIAKKEGVRGLCSGIVPRFMKKGISSVLVWTTYETLKLRSEKLREKRNKITPEDN